MATMLLCDTDTVIEGSSCLRTPCVSEKDRVALRVWALCQALEQIDPDTCDQIIEGSKAVPPMVLNPEFFSAALTSLYLRLAEELGADVPENINELIAEVPCARCDEYGLTNELGLLCALFSILAERHSN